MEELSATVATTDERQHQFASFHGWKDWTNRNILTSSIDETVFIDGYQNPQTIANESSNTQEVSEVVDEDGHISGRSITALQAAWNVTNAIQGMFIVGLPIAVKVGGWWTIAAIIGVAYLCYWTGVLLIDCLYENDVKVRSTYQAVAEAYRPGMGRFVVCAQLTELLSTCIIYIVIAGDLLQNCIPSLDKSALMMLVTTALLGCAFLDSIRVVSNLSLANAISHLIINAIIFVYCLFQVVVNLVLVVKALFSYPLPYYAAVHLLKDNLFMGTPKTLFTSCYGFGHSLREWALCLRMILILMTLMMAMSVPYLIELMGLIGNITGTMLSFIWPAMFHLKLKGASVKESDRKFDKFIVGIGICLMTVGLYFSALELIQAIRYEKR
ncbi:unnamed protein product [Litomosoides sigmodontis]|uniref:Amino acid transporter transmembrane domain-containing protein n=1 Tax=Litomosoides sigmodontis TaxID=42156 RepID=A0A3P6U277_LITSI|nr:unnamed protein product [Litomosoides sigmodontis]